MSSDATITVTEASIPSLLSLADKDRLRDKFDSQENEIYHKSSRGVTSVSLQPGYRFSVEDAYLIAHHKKQNSITSKTLR